MNLRILLNAMTLLLILLPLGVEGEQEFQYLPETQQEVALKPQMRPLLLTETLYTSNTQDLRVYIENMLMFDTEEEFDNLPYLVSFEEDKHLVGAGDVAYAMGLDSATDISTYNLLMPGQLFKDPETGEELGYQAFIIGRANLEGTGAPQKIRITESRFSLSAGTKVIANTAIAMPALIEAKYPDKVLKGYVLSVEYNEVGGGANSFVLINLGKRDGLVQGNVLDLTEGKRVVADLYTGLPIYLPTVKFGQVMVYKVMEKTSLAFVSYSRRIVVPKDIVSVSSQDF